MRYFILMLVFVPLAGTVPAKSSLKGLLEILKNLDTENEKREPDNMNNAVAHGLVDLFKKVVDGCSKDCENKQGYTSHPNAFNFCKLVKTYGMCQTFNGAQVMCEYTCGFCTCKDDENTINVREFGNEHEHELARKLYDGFLKMVDEIY